MFDRAERRVLIVAFPVYICYVVFILWPTMHARHLTVVDVSVGQLTTAEHEMVLHLGTLCEIGNLLLMRDVEGSLFLSDRDNFSGCLQ